MYIVFGMAVLVGGACFYCFAKRSNQSVILARAFKMNQSCRLNRTLPGKIRCVVRAIDEQTERKCIYVQYPLYLFAIAECLLFWCILLAFLLLKLCQDTGQTVDIFENQA